MRVALLGAGGRMGRQLLTALGPDDQLVAAFTHPDDPALGVDAGTLVGGPARGVCLSPLHAHDLDRAEVVIDFSTPAALHSLLPLLGSRALVSGTTGLDAAARQQLQRHAQRGPLLAAANFSSGVTLLCDLVARAAAAMPSAAIEIIETHHRHKVDAPSGTALALGRAAAEARGQRLEDVAVHGRHGAVGPREPASIGFHALRGGDVVGEHSVWLLSDGERVQLGHVASSRATFAHGAVRAAHWLCARPAGSYSMADVLGLTQL